MTPLHLAAVSSKAKAVTILAETSSATINLTDDRGRTAVHLAAMRGYLSVCNKLLRMGADIAGRDDTNLTPLDYSAAKGFSNLMQLLLDYNAPVQASNLNSETALHHAAMNGHVGCVTILLDHGANISTVTKSGKNCLDVALDHYQKTVCMALIKHKRWKDVLRNVDNEGKRPMEKLIEIAPEVAEVVLDRCIEHSKHPQEHRDYSVSYNFEYLDLHPDQRRDGRNYFGPTCMTKYKREQLLSHPLTIQLINNKWAQLGRKTHFLMLLIYMLYVGMVTVLIVKTVEERNRLPVKQNSTAAEVLSGICLALAIIHLIKEIVQMKMIGKSYLIDLKNYTELIFYISTILFTATLLCDESHCTTHAKFTVKLKWQAGAICIFSAWINLLFNLKRFPFFGLVVVMSVEVLKTVVSVLAVFSIVLFAFACCFHVLFYKISDFSTIGRSILKTIIMMTGEFEYSQTINDNLGEATLEFPALSVIVYLLFVLLLPIVMINLMVGLAVGEIAEVRKSAKLLILKEEVKLIKDYEKRYPLSYLRTYYKCKLTVKPNQRNFWTRSMDWFISYKNTSLLSDGMNDTNEQDFKKGNCVIRELEKKVEEQKNRIKKLTQVNDEQSDLFRVMAGNTRSNNNVKKTKKPRKSHGQRWSVLREDGIS